MNWRRLLTVAGIAVFGLSVLELVEPGTVPLPSDGAVLSILAGGVLLYGVAAILGGYRQPERAETPDVEIVTPPEVPGTDLERTLDGFSATGDRPGDDSRPVPEKLRDAAVAVLTRYRGLDTEQARQQVTAGTWTDDTEAADLLSGDDPDPERSLLKRIRGLIPVGSAREERHALSRTVDAVASVAGVDSPDEQDTEELALDPPAETGTAGRRAALGDSNRGEPTQTHHWTGVGVVVFTCLGFGVFIDQPGVVLAGAVAVGYAAYARSTPLGVVELSVSRSVSTEHPDPGETFEVTVTVTNEGGFCPDLRIVDGVPESLAVAEGTARRGMVLRGGESATFSYTLQARQGTHEFGPAFVMARNLSGSTEQELLVEAETTLTVLPKPTPVQTSVPLRRQPTQYAGRAPTDAGGEGLEFHTVREYQPGDSMTRVDWNRRARTGELATLEFRRERATRIVVLVDTWGRPHVGHDPLAADDIGRSTAAAQRLFPALLADGHQVGLGAFGPQECFLAPDTGASHRQRGRALLATHSAFHSETPPEEQRRFWVAKLRTQLPDNAQLLLFSPLVEARTVSVVRELEAFGYPTTVISPDPTTTATPSHRLMCAHRRLLMAELRRTGVPVLDWSPSKSLEAVFKREAATR